MSPRPQGSRKRSESRRRKVTVCATLLPEHRAYLEERAKEKGVSVSEYLRWLLEREMNQAEEPIWLYFTKEGDFDESTLLPKTEGGLAKELWHNISKILDEYALMRTVIWAKEEYKRLPPEKKRQYKSFLHFLLQTPPEVLRGSVLLPHGMDLETAIQYALQNIRKARFYVDSYLDKESKEFLEQIQRGEDEE